MSKQATPGPWNVGGLDARNWRVVVSAAPCVVAAALNTGVGDERDANAYLIAAAPDLAAVCEETADALESADPDLSLYWLADRLRAAVAKARGEEER